MLFATLALAAALPLPASTPLAEAPVRAAPTPCNPDPMKSLGCVAQRLAPTPRKAHVAPLHCNPDPLKGAACHAHQALTKAEQRRQAGREEELASAE